LHLHVARAPEGPTHRSTSRIVQGHLEKTFPLWELTHQGIYGREVEEIVSTQTSKL
jgi:hypothetical protein